MIPATGGETAFKQFQAQVHNQIEEPLRRKIEKFMDHCCMDADTVTDEDVEFIKEMAGLMDPYGERGLLKKIEEMDTGVYGLKDRQVAMTAKGIIEGFIRATWSEENRPVSTVANAIAESLEDIRSSSYEDYIAEHPEKLKQIAPVTDENILKKLNDLENMISSLKEENSALKNEIENIRKAKEMVQPENSEKIIENKETEKKEIKVENKFLDFSIDRYWLVSFKDDEYTEIDLEYNIQYPSDYSKELFLRAYIENENSKRRVAMTEFQVYVQNQEAYDVLFNRLRSSFSEFLASGSVKTDILIQKDFNKNMSYKPKFESGKIWRIQIGNVDYKHLEPDAFLIISLGNSYLKYSIKVRKNDLPQFVNDVSDLIELILQTGETIVEKVG